MDSEDKEIHTHLLIKPHEEWLHTDLLSLATSLTETELSECGIACFDFSANCDSLGRISYVCKADKWGRDKKVDYSKGFNRWIKRHLPQDDPVYSSLNQPERMAA
jgi:hypothetical protein